MRITRPSASSAAPPSRLRRNANDRNRADRVSLGNREFAGFMIGAAVGGFAGATLEDPVAAVLGLVFGAAVGAAVAASFFSGGRPGRQRSSDRAGGARA